MKKDISLLDIKKKIIKEQNVLLNDVSLTVGSIVKITHILSKGSKLEQSLVGICIAYKKKYLDSAITILFFSDREIVRKSFPIYSPLVKQIVILEKQNYPKLKLYSLQENKKIIQKRTYKSNY